MEISNTLVNVAQIINITDDFTTEDIETWLKCDENASQFAVLSDEEIISMANSNSDEPERDNGLEDTDENEVIVSETTLKEAIEASSTLLNFLDSPGCSGITEQDKIQVYRIQEKLIKENYKLKNIRQTILHDFF